jgi:hypothetical protein
MPACAAFTAADVPGQRFVGLIRQDWLLMIAIGEETLRRRAGRYRGRTEPGPCCVSVSASVRGAGADHDPNMALLSDSPPIHPAGNLLSRTTVKRGDLRGQAQRPVAHGIYQTQMTTRMGGVPLAYRVTDTKYE